MFVLNKAIALALALLSQQATEKNFKPLGEITGHDSAIEQPMATLVTSQKMMGDLWMQHKEIFGDSRGQVLEAQVPEVDFKKNMVVAYFAGQTQGMAGFRIVAVDVKGKANIIRIVSQPFSGVAADIVGNGYGMWVFPVSKKPIELELVVGYERGRPIVKKLARFEPPKAAKSTG